MDIILNIQFKEKHAGLFTNYLLTGMCALTLNV